MLTARVVRTRANEKETGCLRYCGPVPSLACRLYRPSAHISACPRRVRAARRSLLLSLAIASQAPGWRFLFGRLWGGAPSPSAAPSADISHGGKFYREASAACHCLALCSLRKRHPPRPAHHAWRHCLQRVFAPQARRGHVRSPGHEAWLRDPGQVQEWRDVGDDSYVCSRLPAPSPAHRNSDTSIRNKDVFIVQSGSEKYVASSARPAPIANPPRINDSVMELLIMISACKGGSAKSVTGSSPLRRHAASH